MPSVWRYNVTRAAVADRSEMAFRRRLGAKKEAVDNMRERLDAFELLEPPASTHCAEPRIMSTVGRTIDSDSLSFATTIANTLFSKCSLPDHRQLYITPFFLAENVDKIMANLAGRAHSGAMLRGGRAGCLRHPGSALQTCSATPAVGSPTSCSLRGIDAAVVPFEFAADTRQRDSEDLCQDVRLRGLIGSLWRRSGIRVRAV